IPLDTPAGHPATIRRNNTISLRGQELKIPTKRIRLRGRGLWTALTIQYGRIVLIRIEIRWIYYPREQVLTVRSFGKSTFDFDIFHTGINIIIHRCQWTERLVFKGEMIYFRSTLHCRGGHDQTFLCFAHNSGNVKLTLADLLYRR